MAVPCSSIDCCWSAAFVSVLVQELYDLKASVHRSVIHCVCRTASNAILMQESNHINVSMCSSQVESAARDIVVAFMQPLEHREVSTSGCKVQVGTAKRETLAWCVLKHPIHQLQVPRVERILHGIWFPCQVLISHHGLEQLLEDVETVKVRRTSHRFVKLELGLQLAQWVSAQRLKRLKAASGQLLLLKFEHNRRNTPREAPNLLEQDLVRENLHEH